METLDLETIDLVSGHSFQELFGMSIPEIVDIYCEKLRPDHDEKTRAWIVDTTLLILTVTLDKLSQKLKETGQKMPLEEFRKYLKDISDQVFNEIEKRNK